MTELAYQGFALLELMGYRQRIGRVSEVEMVGGKLLRIDVIVPGSFSPTPMTFPACRQAINHGAVYES